MQKLSAANCHTSLMIMRDNISSRLTANGKLMYVGRRTRYRKTSISMIVVLSFCSRCRWNFRVPFNFGLLGKGCNISVPSQVYDFICCDSQYEKLHFVINAGRSPLEESDADRFKEKYGLDKVLRFRPHNARVASPADWWAAV